jgi:glycine hydroxymethyltransferase
MNPQLQQILGWEKSRQDNYAQLIASENFASDSVMAMSGSIFTNKYAEGYPDARYYNGCKYYDEVENMAIHYLQQSFRTNYFCNVQPHSGANANLAVMTALLEPGDTILSLNLSMGGHLSHGHPVNISGKLYNIIGYGLTADGILNYTHMADMARLHKPKMIIAGASAYPLEIDWSFFKRIADEVGAILLCDIAHYSGLIAGGAYPSPFPYADVVTSTTHKTLRGPRGGVIFWRDEKLTKKIDNGVFPGTQGGPLMNQVAAKAQAFYEASLPSFKVYAKKVVRNAEVMAEVFVNRGLNLVSGGTESHMIILNLIGHQKTGADIANALEEKKIVVNKNSVPFDSRPPRKTSGIRLGTAAETTRGRSEEWFRETALQIVETIYE